MLSPALKTLKKYWGFSSFRSVQKKVIISILEKNDTIALLPTGGGKSLCFQIPGILKEGVCVVISPLLALMQDQTKSLNNKGIKATYIPSGSTQDDIIDLFDNIRFGNYKFLYISPERLQSRFIQEKIKQLSVSLIAIDEAHCISEWGHDFRTSYRNISILREIHPTTPIIALTATATAKVITDISQSLELKKPTIFKKSFYRENLNLNIIKTEDKLYKLKQIFTKIKAPSIIYVNTRKQTRDLCKYLNANKFSSTYYHAGLTTCEKEENFENWILERKQIMVATNAFGMGIDKNNVSLVIHYNLPNSIEHYMQESGRAGRNNKIAYAITLTNKSDIKLALKTQENSLPSLSEIKEIHRKLYQQFQISFGEINNTNFSFNLLDFCNKYNFLPNKTFYTLQLLTNFGIVNFNQQSQQLSNIKFLLNSKQTIQYSNNRNKEKKLLEILLRMYGGIFENYISINEFTIAKKAGVTSTKVITFLEQLAHNNIIDYQKGNTNSSLSFLTVREDDKTINRISKDLKLYIKHKKEKTSRLINFISNDTSCRWNQLLIYFGEETTTKCGHCDVCNSSSKNTKKIEDKIIELINQHTEISSKEICKILPYTEQQILVTLRFLLAEEKIKLKYNNCYYI